MSIFNNLLKTLKGNTEAEKVLNIIIETTDNYDPSIFSKDVALFVFDVYNKAYKAGFKDAINEAKKVFEPFDTKA